MSAKKLAVFAVAFLFFVVSLILSKIIVDKKQGHLLQEGMELAAAAQYQKAAEKFAAYLKGKPENLVAQSYSMDCYAKLGHWDKAESVAVLILKTDTEHVAALLTRGEAALYRQEWSAADEYFSKVARMDGQSLEALRGLAFVSLGKGDAKKAEEWANKAAGLSAEDGKTILCRAMIAQAKGENEEALRLAGKAQAALGNDSLVLLTTAKIHQAAGNIAQARELYENLLLSYPDLPEARRGMAQVHESRQENEPAAELYEKILKDNPKDSRAVLALMRMHQEQGKAAEAVTLAEEYLSRVAGDKEVNAAYARLLVDQGQTDKALELLEKIGQSDKGFLPAYLTRAAAYQKLGKTEEALAEIRKALALNPNYAEGHVALGQALMAKGMDYEGLQSLQKGLELQPAYPHLHYLIGVGFLKAGFADIAAQELKAETDAYPGNADAWHYLGLAYAKLGKPEEAREAYDKVLAKDPSNLDIRYNLALSQAKSGKQAEAMAAFEEILKVKPDDLPSTYNLAVLYARGGKNAEAMALFKKVLSWDASNVDAHDHVARIYESQGDWDAAIAEYDAVLKVPGLESADTVWARISALQTKKKDLVRAREAADKAIEINPKNPLAYALMAPDAANLPVQEMLTRANIYFEQGNLEEARKEWEKAVQTDPQNLAAKLALKKLADLRAKDEAQISAEQASEDKEEGEFQKRRKWEANIAKLLKEGQALFDAGSYEQAAAKWSEVLITDPRNTVAPLNIALARKMMAPAGQPADGGAAAQEDQRGRTKMMEQIQEGLSTGDLFMNIGDYTAAIEEYQHVLEIDPANPVAKAKLIAAQQSLGKTDATGLEAQKRGALAGKLGEQKKARNIMGLLTQGEVKFKEASFDDAIEIWTKVLEINPANDQAREKIAEARDLKLMQSKRKKGEADKREFIKQKAMIKIKEAQLKKKKTAWGEGSFRFEGMTALAISPAKKKLQLSQRPDAFLDERFLD